MKYFPLLAILLVIGCTGATTTAYSTLAIPTANIYASAGDKVSFEYTLKFEDGTLVETGTDEIIMGTGQKILNYPLDEILSGMKIGEYKTIKILPRYAYGEYDSSKIATVPLKTLHDEGIIPVEGMTVILNGHQRTISKISDETVLIDLNHPDSGKSIALGIEVTNIR